MRNSEPVSAIEFHEHEKPSRDETLIGPPANYSGAAEEPLLSSLGVRGLKLLANQLLANQAVRVGFKACAKSVSAKRQLRLKEEL